MKMPPVKSSEESDASMRARLVESLSHSFPGSALSKALHSMDEEMDMDPLSRSCFAELRLDIKQESETDEEEFDFDEEIEEEEIDEELTSLSWLQDQDLLKNIRAGDQSLCASPTEEVQKENALINGGNNHLGNPPHVPYNPQKHINSKPPYSFSCLIFMAIEDSPVKKLPVKDIYNWILTHFPYFQNAPTGWKNSVRHNLSLNKCFRKVEKEKGSSIGKGSLWMIDPDYRPNLLQALRKTPYHPYHQLQMLSSPQNNTSYTILPGSPRPALFPQRFNINTPSPHLFPFLSRRLAQSKLETESDIDVANTLVSLKRAAENRRPLTCQNGYAVHGNRSRSPSPPEFGSEEEKQMIKRKRASRPRLVLCTSNPSSDHTYSITQEILDGCVRSPASSIDEEYEFGEQDRSRSDLDRDSFSDRNSDSSCDDEIGRDLVVTDYRPRRPQKRKFVRDEDEEDEHKKIVEGADALLNLAGIKTSLIVPMRSISPSEAVCHNNNNLLKVKAEPEDS